MVRDSLPFNSPALGILEQSIQKSPTFALSSAAMAGGCTALPPMTSDSFGEHRMPSSQPFPRVSMPVTTYPFTGMAGKVAGTFAMPTVTPLFDRMDHSGSFLSMSVRAVAPPTTKPVMPFSSGEVLVAIVVYTFGQFGAGSVRIFPYTPRWMTLAKLGI